MTHEPPITTLTDAVAELRKMSLALDLGAESLRPLAPALRKLRIGTPEFAKLVSDAREKLANGLPLTDEEAVAIGEDSRLSKAEGDVLHKRGSIANQIASLAATARDIAATLEKIHRYDLKRSLKPLRAGTTSERPKHPSEGEHYYDTTLRTVVQFVNGSWRDVSAERKPEDG